MIAALQTPAWWLATLAAAAVLVLCATAMMTVIVEHEAKYTLESLGGAGEPRALILFHPSRDAQFTDDLSLAVGEGLRSAGYAVDRATMTALTPAQPEGYRLIVVVSNTYFWTPDLPTLRYLKRAKLDWLATLGVIGGMGSTQRAQHMLEQSLADSGARLIEVRAFWTTRPNDELRATEPNREVALQLARQLGLSAGTKELKSSAPKPAD